MMQKCLGRELIDLYLVQRYKNDVWTTISASTFEDDAVESFDALTIINTMLGRQDEPIRQVTVTVTDLDFLMIYARDVQITHSNLTPDSV